MKIATHNSFKELYEARHEPENLQPIAEAFWRTLLLFAVVAAGVVILFGAWEFSSVIATVSAATSDGGGAQAAPIDRAQLEQVLNQFSERKANYEMSKGLVPTATDPSK